MVKAAFFRHDYVGPALQAQARTTVGWLGWMSSVYWLRYWRDGAAGIRSALPRDLRPSGSMQQSRARDSELTCEQSDQRMHRPAMLSLQRGAWAVSVCSVRLMLKLHQLNDIFRAAVYP